MVCRRQTLFLDHRGQEIHHTYKAGRSFPMSYWYSTDGSTVNDGGPAGDPWFDVRSLPEQYRQGLNMEGRKDHREAIKRALDDGYQLVNPSTDGSRNRRANYAAVPLDPDIPF